MRPNIDIDWGCHGPIKDLAKARFDGDLNAAYTAVIKRGLKYTAVPEDSIVVPDGEYACTFIESHSGRSTFPTPITFYRGLKNRLRLDYTYSANQRSLESSELTNALRTIGRYTQVDIDNAAFCIRRPRGLWAGFEFGNFIAALEQPIHRYQHSPFEQMERETFGFIFDCETGTISLSGTYVPEFDEVRDLSVRAFSIYLPIGIQKIIPTIFNHLGTRITPPTEFTGQLHSTTESHPVEQTHDEYVTTEGVNQPLVKAVSIENPFANGLLETTSDECQQPEHVFMHISDSLPVTEAEQQQFVLNEAHITGQEFDVLNMSLHGSVESR